MKDNVKLHRYIHVMTFAIEIHCKAFIPLARKGPKSLRGKMPKASISSPVFVRYSWNLMVSKIDSNLRWVWKLVRSDQTCQSYAILIVDWGYIFPCLICLKFVDNKKDINTRMILNPQSDPTINVGVATSWLPGKKCHVLLCDQPFWIWLNW